MTSKDNYQAIWKLLEPVARRKEVGARQWLLNEGDVSQTLFYIQEGCLRLWFNDHGHDVTFQFFFEGEFVGSVESFKLGKPSLFTIETVLPSVLYTIHKDDALSVIEDSVGGRKAANELLYQRLYHYQRLFLSRIKNSPRRRYEELAREHPGLLEKIPHHYIASYLGITPVSLSRIRTKIKQEKDDASSVL